MARLNYLLLGGLFATRLVFAADPADSGAPATSTISAVASSTAAPTSGTVGPAPASTTPTNSKPAVAVATAAADNAPAPDDPWLRSLTVLLTDHYQPMGELVLSFARPRPAAIPANATLVLGSCPTELATQLLVNVRASDQAGHVTDCLLVLHAEVWRDGWTLREPVATGTLVQGSALDLRRYDALREHDALAADPALDLNFARNIPAGRLLTWHDVVRRPLVHRGQPVEVSATDGPLTVTLRALSLQDAARGEMVRVRNLDTNKEFTAIVTAEARAAVNF